MTKKDYALIAEALRLARYEGHGLNSASIKYMREQWTTCVAKIAQALKRDNPRFKTDRFLKACGCETFLP